MKWKQSELEKVRTGATLRTLREARGLNADELARELHVSRPYLANIEAGRRSLTPALAKKSCEVLSVRPIVLLNPTFLEDHLETSVDSKKRASKLRSHSSSLAGTGFQNNTPAGEGSTSIYSKENS